MSHPAGLPIRDFDFAFPEELVADKPAEPRDSARLLAVERAGGAPRHLSFRDLPGQLRAGDVIVLNRTKVLPARLQGRKSTGGKAEVLLVKEIEPGVWAALSSGLKAGGKLIFPGGMAACVEGLNEDGEYLLSFSKEDVSGYLEANGLLPLPPYILKRQKILGTQDDGLGYQTIYAREPGSIAAPTAGLHFTDDLLSRLKNAGIETAELLLHVGRGTFRPITAEDAEKHPMGLEWYRLEEEAAERIRRARRAGGRIVAVGTTATRTLETLSESGETLAGEGWTRLYIRPGHRFRGVDALITNFHLPRSTPLLLASAFLGRERLLECYAEAFRERYRLYSYGDAMLIL
mgnify:CR=1 FL=1